MGIADNPGDARERGKLFGGALGVAAGDNETDGGVGSVKLANGIASLGVSRGRNGASVDDDDVSGSGRGCGRATAVEQLALDGGAIGLRGAATELFDEEGRHLRVKKTKEFKQSSPRPGRGKRRTQRTQREDPCCSQREPKLRIPGLGKSEKTDRNQDRD